MKRTLLLLPLLAVIAACSQDATSPATQRARTAPLLSRSADGTGGYIVVLNRGADARGVAAVAGVQPKYVYGHALSGFAATLNEGQLNALQHNPNVAFIEADGVVQASTTLTGATWGLDRIDQRDLPLSTTYTYLNTGAGVTAYIIDTGLRFTHAEVVGRASSGYDAVDGGTADDCNGHGTHTAGTVGGLTYGVAKGVSLVAVRVLDCNGSGTTSGVIAGVDWVTANHVSPAVANMSLGGGANTSLDNAVANSIASGVTYAIAAGNGNIFGIAQNACNSSPARVASAITVGATDKTDKKASWSNFGTCLDLFAPGVNITSSWYTSDIATNTISGTSMATPHVAGVAALYLQGNPSATPAQVASALVANATTGKVTSAGTGSPNRLLFENY
ncbi:MAG TPA: S8 family peptidase [Longimicrobium sp.]|nr:S8 family peptidase [Longimicrobium sp.]